MKLLRWCLVLSSLAFTGALAPAAVAQTSAQKQPRFHATLGIHVRRHELSGIGPGGGIAEGAVNVRTFTSRSAGITIGALVGKSVTLTGDDLNCPIDPAGGCRPGLPDLSYAGVQFGVEGRYGPFTASLTSGPTAMHFESMRKVGGVDASGQQLFPILPASTVLSIHTRAEVAAYVAGHLGFVLSSTWRHLPQFRGAPYDINGLGVGIRIQ